MSAPVQNNTALSFTESVSGALNEKAMGYLQIGQDDGMIKTVAKYTAKEIVSLLNVVAGTVESVIRNVLLVVAKTVQFFIPKGYTESFDSKVLNPLRQHAYFNSVNSLNAVAHLVTNFLSDKSQAKVENKIINTMNAVYNSNFSNGVMNFHFNGFKAEAKKEEAPVEEAAAEEAPEEAPKATWADTARYAASFLNPFAYGKQA